MFDDCRSSHNVLQRDDVNNVLSKRYSKHAISENIKYLVACFSFCQAYADGVNKDETLYKELFVDPRPDQARSRLECLELN